LVERKKINAVIEAAGNRNARDANIYRGRTGIVDPIKKTAGDESR